MSDAFQRVLERTMRDMAANLEEDFRRGLWVGSPRAVPDDRPFYGPSSSKANDLSEDELEIRFSAENDSYTFTCPGWESEPVTLSAEQVDALCARLMKHRTRTLYP